MEYTREFTKGTKGEDVRAFQTNLIFLGYPLPKYGADAVYGSETEGAAKKCCEDYHWDFCSWGPCPIWCQEWVEKAAQEKPAEGWMPSGRGMWIQSMNNLSGAEEAEKIVKNVNLKFVIVQVHWQYEGKGSTTYNWPTQILGLRQSYGCNNNARNAVECFRSLGVHVIPFSYPVPGKHQEVVDVLGEFATLWTPPTVVIDPEAEWKSSSGAYEGDALELAAMLSAEFDSWGMSSYGAPWYHRSFPFTEFSTATYGLPQTYGVTTFGTDEGMERALNEWRGYGYQRLVNLYGTYSKTDAQMRQLLNVVARTNPVATAGWKWGTTSDPEWDHINNILPE